MERRNRIWLIVPGGLFYLIDVILTLVGQSREYWAGAYSTAIETNPIALEALEMSPVFFGFMAGTWAIVLASIIICWRHPISAGMAVFVAFAHTIGGSTWLIRWEQIGWLAALGYMIVAAQFSFWCWRRCSTSERLAKAKP